jgi:hypothetical protein
MREESALAEALAVIGRRLATYSGRSIGEQNTKVGLIHHCCARLVGKSKTSARCISSTAVDRATSQSTTHF